MRSFLRSKIHQATVTDADVNYVGSISIDEALIEKAGLAVGEQVLVVSNTSGARLETYVMAAERDSGTIGMNGAAAHLIQPGEQIIVMAFEWSESPVQPVKIRVDDKNRFTAFLD